MPENMDLICSVISSMPGGAMISICGAASARSISISRSSSAPSRSRLRKVWRVLLSLLFSALGTALLKPKSRAGGSRMSSTRSSAASSARVAHLALFLLAGLLDADVDQVADDGVDVAADIADFGELGGLDLDEGRIGQLGQAARDLGLADAGRADHQDVLRRDLVAQRLLRPAGGASGCAAQWRPRAWRVPWPTTCLSSSETISGGVMFMLCPVSAARRTW